MKGRINVGKNASPRSIAKRLGLSDGNYLAFKGPKGVYIAELDLFFKRTKEMGLTLRDNFFLLTRGAMDMVPPGDYDIRETKRCYSLERVAA